MNQLSKLETDTISYYDQHAKAYVNDTVDVNMLDLYQPFLEIVPSGGKILDAGCGSGRDTKAFLERGYDVTAIDASKRMAESATALTHVTVDVQLIQDMRWQNTFDGIWACASLLHIPSSDMPVALERLADALKPDGICYISFKEGEGERVIGKRLFTYFSEITLKGLVDAIPRLSLIRTWTTVDLRRSRTNEIWLNALIRKVNTEMPHDEQDG